VPFLDVQSFSFSRGFNRPRKLGRNGCIKSTPLVYLPISSEISGSAGIFEDNTIISEDSRRSPRSSEEVRSPSSSHNTRIKASSFPVLYTSKIRDRKEGIGIYSFYTWFSSLVWV